LYSGKANEEGATRMRRNITLTVLCLLIATLATCLLAFRISFQVAFTFLCSFSLLSSFATFIKINRLAHIRSISRNENVQQQIPTTSSIIADEHLPVVNENSSHDQVRDLMKVYRTDDSDICRWFDDGGALSQSD
jgi:hypothetical protein